jgi:hypothetical protein
VALDNFIAGRYTGTFQAVDVGITSNGYELEQTSSAEMIEESDYLGGSALDAIYRGGNAFLMFESLAYKAGSIAPFWPWASLGILASTTLPIGRRASDVAGAMVLTSTPNTPAAAAPATLTGPSAILAPNQSARLLFNSKLRKVPVRLQLFPFVNGAAVQWWM